MKYLFWSLLLGMLCGIPAQANTIFSFHGVGDMARRIDARSRAMGGAGRAIVDGQNFSTHNPALLGGFFRTAISAQFLTQRRTLDGGGAVNDGDVAGFLVVAPTRIGVVSVGINALSDMDFGARDAVGTGDLGYELQLNATGGLQAVSVAMGRRVAPRAYLGARLDWVVMGTLNEQWIKTFNGQNVFYSHDDIVRTHRGWVPSFGGIFTPGQHWSIGGNVQVGRSIRQRQILTTRFVAQNAASKIETQSQIELPYVTGLGVAYLSGYRWIAAVDVERGFWSETEPGRFDTWDISAGMLVRTGNPDPLFTGRRFEFNAGVHYRSLYFPTASGSQIGEIGASLGVALPLKTETGHLRYMLEFGKRGDRNKHGVSERFIMQSFAISGFFF